MILALSEKMTATESFNQFIELADRAEIAVKKLSDPELEAHLWRAESLHSEHPNSIDRLIGQLAFVLLSAELADRKDGAA